MPTKTTEDEIGGIEELNTLPVNHPQAGYLPPKPNEGFGTGTLPPAEQEALDQQIEDWQSQAQEIKTSEEAALAESQKDDEETVAPVKAKTSSTSDDKTS